VRTWQLRPGIVQAPRETGTSTVGSHYRATAIERLTVDNRERERERESMPMLLLLLCVCGFFFF
jgi:hypothetical protein